ncbi:hypothetical protein FA13DRAFT_1736337 [Coprinellus micaceus]|uniref:Protein kinase domain-containing protein n=1 Tax=Coprinellus micaceus TaxID=71717 RepID=A0A4Y7T1H6_COPMI|nr:hypothetical protein FA13DRAFT_1736337 [Coprinellus micaceus]
MARLQFLVIVALLGHLLSSNALPVRNNIAAVTHLSRDVPEILDLETRAAADAAAKRPTAQKAAPRKKVVAKKSVAKKTKVPKKVAAPKKAVPAGKKTPKKIATKKTGKAAEPDFCELPVKAKNGKAAEGAKLAKRGCASSRPVLDIDQIRLDNRVFTIGSRIDQGANGIVFNVEGTPGLVAKQFKASASQQDFIAEVGNLRAARHLTASGSSTLGPTGTAANWIITNKVDGKKLTGVREFKDAMKRPHADCVRYLEGIYTQFVTKYVALQKSTKLYHGDATNENTFFNDKSQLVDFIDFGNMKTSLNDLKTQEFNPSLSGAASIEAFARARAELNWPKRNCPRPSSP